MSIEHTSFFTIRCDIRDCKDRFTAPDPETFYENGWETINIFNEDVSLCPDHVNELKDFIFND